jgi:serine/threonine-protein kinase ULK4
MVGRDLLAGLQFIHSKGIICCDLKPANLLLDEQGTLKFADFGLAQLVGDIAAGGEQSKRGTPCYMAPELFQDDGYQSFASDFWSLGCVLYEMAAGSPPFVSTSFRELMDMILQQDVPPIAGSSTAFCTLLSGLLSKDRFERLDWSQLVAHEFWPEGITPEFLPLPQQPRFDADADARLEAAAARATTSQQRKTRGGRGSVDVMRLSRAAQTNLAKEVERAQEDSSYRDDGAGDSGGQPGRDGQDVALQNPNVELNFAEQNSGTKHGGNDDADDHVRLR